MPSDVTVGLAEVTIGVPSPASASESGLISFLDTDFVGIPDCKPKPI